MKPVYNDHPDSKIVAVVDRWSLFERYLYAIIIQNKFNKRDLKMVAVIGR